MAAEASSSDRGEIRVLQFASFQSLVDEGFWRKLCSLKLDKLGLDDAPIEITGFYAPSTHTCVPQHMSLLSESLSSDSSDPSIMHETLHGNRNRCPAPGIIYNMNTLESFRALDKGRILKDEAMKIWRDIWSGKAEEEPSVLSRFLVVSFADLKRWKFYYWFAFPALVLDPPAKGINLEPASEFFSTAEASSLSVACGEWRKSSTTSEVPFFLVAISSDSHATLRPLKDFGNYQHRAKKLLFGFYDPCHLPNYPGWPLRNFLVFIAMRWKLDKIRFLCYRESRGVADLSLSLVGEAMVSIPQEWHDPKHTPKAVGWEPNKGKLSSRRISLAESMDPNRLVISAADLNLKLMRWRMLPSLNLDILSSLKCLLLGAGTLGCQVARMLMAWGIRKITLVDNGRVSMSNPLRQSLYTFDNCLNGGELKALAAAKSLEHIFPGVEAEGISLSIPMPGHPVSSHETAGVLEDCKNLETLVASHDVIFLLTDTRESRWLPTLLCTNSDKITITAALGFDNYLVMRHGAGPRITNKNISEHMEKLSIGSMDQRQRLGCYFCNDVVAPIDSISNRTLDQQCTVTRPGLAPIASSIAVELLVGVLHHPEGTNARGEISDSIVDESDRALGILPHQIRGSLSQFSQLTLMGYSSDSCTACSTAVISEYRKRGMDFLLEAINHPTYLEDITGLTALMNSASSFDLDWDDEVDHDA